MTAPRPADTPTPWLASYPLDVDWHAPLPTTTLLEVFDAAVRDHPANTCLDFLGRRYSYAEVADLVRRAAHGLQRLGVQKGTHMGLLLPNTPHYVILYYATLRAGGTVANLNPLYATDEIAHLLRDTGTRIVATLDIRRIYDKVAGAQKTADLDHVILCPFASALPFGKRLLFSLLRRRDVARPRRSPGLLRWRDLTANEGQPAPVEIDPDRDVAVLQFTGGTTGTPKAAMLSHRNLAANVEQVRRTVPSLRRGQERFLGILPLCHSFGMTAVMNLAIRTAGTLILLPRFHPKETLAAIARARPGVFSGVPAIFAALNAYPDLHRYDLRSLRICTSGGAALPAGVQQTFERNTGCTLVEGYGQSECSPVATSNMFTTGRRKVGSIGLPVPHTHLAILALDGSEPVPAGERGEICIRGPQVMLGYRNRPDATARTIVDGWLRTGDVGWMDPEGYTFLVDRLKDVIVRDGYKAYPRVIEEAIRAHPDVAEVCVAGLPDDRHGACPVAFVQPRTGAALTESVLRDFLAPRLSPVEMPKTFEFHDCLPQTPVGKPDRRALVAGARARGA